VQDIMQKGNFNRDDLLREVARPDAAGHGCREPAALPKQSGIANAAANPQR
jgi:hypothetical protein